MQEYCDDRKYVRVFIGSLTDRTVTTRSNLLAEGTHITGMALHAAMFGFLSQQFKRNMVDILDKKPTRKSTFNRILKSLVDLFFVQPFDEVANGCATSIIEILENTFPEMLEPDQTQALMNLFINPLLDLLPGRVGSGNVLQTNAACFCLRKLVQYFIKSQKQLMTYELANVIVTQALVSLLLNSSNCFRDQR